MRIADQVASMLGGAPKSAPKRVSPRHVDVPLGGNPGKRANAREQRRAAMLEWLKAQDHDVSTDELATAFRVGYFTARDEMMHLWEWRKVARVKSGGKKLWRAE